MNPNPDVSRFSIYHCPAHDKKRHKEACGILHLLLRLDQFIQLDDVQFGGDPPDFIFQHQGKSIGTELTDLDPKCFETGGNRLRGQFNGWQAKIERDALPHKFDWGGFSLREALAAFQSRLSIKRGKASHWCHRFPERWLLMRIADGSPFGDLVASQQDMKLEPEPGMESEFADYFAKAMHGIYTICQDIRPFDYVLLFRETDLATSICNLLTFPANPRNPHQLPVPSDEILKRGESASVSFLDWRKRSTTVITVLPGAFGREGALEK